MGDRGNIVVDGVFLYAHWGGAELRKTLGKALKRGEDRRVEITLVGWNILGGSG